MKMDSDIIIINDKIDDTFDLSKGIDNNKLIIQ
jgi:hypothetical protein